MSIITLLGELDKAVELPVTGIKMRVSQLFTTKMENIVLIR